MKKSTAYTKEEAREMMLDHIRVMCEYWAREDRRPDIKDKLNGLAFSILTMLDGETMELPAMDIVLRPHPDDKAYHQSNGEKWFKDGMVINDAPLHELFYK